ncbi:threonine ammonia-lyase, biosynthetic [Candidatus Marinamargulisbacteria bacterium SCGC AG-439-L15]|nr:threonine ammonia-lyase, biosynthetic [Candidatus Marinamargulisbacteria bacterium SCGC AG-439-L15]
MKDLIQDILSSNIYDVVKNTPLDKLSFFSDASGNSVYLKREDLQDVHSFKIRGAYNKISMLSEAQKKKGIIASSAGNHAQGVALSAKKLSLKATIVMPITTPAIKVSSVKSYGAKVILHGDSYDEAYHFASDYAKKNDLSFIHPYDDHHVIAGQGTIAKEICDTLGKDQIDYVFIPVGGGGLVAGMAAYLKHINPKIKVIGVEHEHSACLNAALKNNKRVTLPYVDIFADGVAVKQIGKLPFDILKDKVDSMQLVTTDEICASIKDIYDNIRAIAEPAGAMSLAAIKKYTAQHGLKNKVCVGLLCGANINFHRLRHISERAEIGENKEALFAVNIPEQKGEFLRFCALLKGRSITEFNYRFTTSKEAHIFVGIQLDDAKKETDHLKTTFQQNNYAFQDLTDNDCAKLHIRYMVGGKVATLKNEKVFRFQFPERPGALLQFLEGLGSQWNITMFHYRNHGSAFGRVLVGVDISKETETQFFNYLDSLGYTYFDETMNKAYKLFL